MSAPRAPVGFKIRRAAVEANIPCLTSLETAAALVEAMRAVEEALCLPKLFKQRQEAIAGTH